MAGLLDAFDSPDAQLGLGLLAAASPRADGAGFGQRLMEGVNNSIAMKRAAAQEKMLKLQMEAAQRKSDMMNDWLKQLQGGEQGLTTGGQADGMGSPGVSIGGVTAGGPSSVSATPIGASAGTLGGIPRSAAFADLAMNDGKNLSQWMYDRSKPNWVNIDGNMVNTNAPDFKGGIQGGISQSADGKTLVRTVGPNGQISVAPAAGSLDAYSAFQTAAKRSENSQTLMPQDRINPATNRPYDMTVDQYINGGAKQDTNKPFGNFAGDPAEVLGQIAQIKDPKGRADALAAFQSQMQAGGGKLLPSRESNGFAGPTELAASKELATQGATLSAQQLFDSHKQASSAADSLLGLREARNAIAGGVYAGAGADMKLNVAKGLQALGISVDPEKVTNTDYLKSQVGQNVLAKAKTLGANPTEADARRIDDIVGTIGKDPQALNKLLDYQEMMLRRTIDKHNTVYSQAKTKGFDPYYDMTVTAPESSAQKPSARTYDMLPPANQFTGKRMASEDGTVYRSNGKKWIKE